MAFYHVGNCDCPIEHNALSDAQAENERLREALKFYARDWDESVELPVSPALPKGGVQKFWSILRNEDTGETARKALEEKP